MAGIRFLDKTPQNINFVINQLIRPEIRLKLFDDYCGWNEISRLMYSSGTAIYGIFEKGSPLPVAVVFLTGVVPYRDCTLYACVFDKENRGKGLIKSQADKIERDIYFKFFISSVTSYTIGKNEASTKLLEGLGFEKIGVKPRGIVSNGNYKDLHVYYRLIEDPRKAMVKEEEKKEE